MGRWIAIAVTGLIAAQAVGYARSQDMAAIEKAEAALVEAWQASPIAFRRAIFVSEPPQGFGLFKEREDAVFAPGEPLVVYAEPVGYEWKEGGDGTYTFGFEIDLALKSPDGEVLVEKEQFQRLALTSHARNREFMLTLTLDISGAPAGDYVVEYRARDVNGSKAGLISLPFSIAE